MWYKDTCKQIRKYFPLHTNTQTLGQECAHAHAGVFAVPREKSECERMKQGRNRREQNCGPAEQETFCVLAAQCLLQHQLRKRPNTSAEGLTLLHFRFCCLAAVVSVSKEGMEKTGRWSLHRKCPARKASVSAQKDAAHW